MVGKDSWDDVKRIFAEALEMPAAERAAFLADECGSNAALRDEVESLLLSHDETGDFLERPAASLPSFNELETVAEPSDFGLRIGAYRLEQEIGRGGMGTVYLAVRADEEFRKRVAIKQIRRGRETEFAIRRLRNERQILATLEHPNIARLIDGGTTTDGLPYFVMEYVEGEPLHRYCAAHSLATDERLNIFLKVCSAVQYAHRRLIIHRDLKPTNVLVKKDGTPKLLDFGIAKLLQPEPGTDAENTATGLHVLTPAYASPEQLRGEPATVRSDIYSLGVMLHELLTGVRPGPKASHEEINAATEEGPLTGDLRVLVLRAIRWAPEDRYESVEALAADVQRYRDGITLSPTGEQSARGAAPPGSVAILPFQVLDCDSTSDVYLGTGMTDALITKLSAVGRMLVKPTSAVLKYSAPGDAPQAGKDLSVEYVLEGRIHNKGDRVRVSVQLVRCTSGNTVWAASFDERQQDLLRLEDSISEQVAMALLPQLTGEERERIARRGTTNPKAHEAYLRGRWHWSRSITNTEDLARALVCFMEAIAIDPNYAKAHAGVANYYIVLGMSGGLRPAESFAAAKERALTAIQLDPASAEGHAALGFALWALERDLNAAAEHFQLAIMSDPDYAVAHQWYGLLNSARGKHELAIASLERARKLDPFSPVAAASLALCYHNARQFSRAVEVARTALQHVGEAPVVYSILAWALLELEDVPGALQAARRGAGLSGTGSLVVAALSHAEARAGNLQTARAIAESVEDEAERQYVSGYVRAAVQIAAGHRAKALHILAQARADCDWWMVWLDVSPGWDFLRRNPRFTRAVAPVETKRPYRTMAAVAAVVILIAAVVVWRVAAMRAGAFFPSFKIAKLTTNGTAQLAAISPDANTVAYTTSEGGKTRLWVRDLKQRTAARAIAEFSSDITGLAFTDSGHAVSFVSFSWPEPARRMLYKVALADGRPRLLRSGVPAQVSLTDDGTRAAYMRADRAAGRDGLYVSNPDGSAERLLATTTYPERFTRSGNAAWSPDGRAIVAGVETTDTKGFYIRLVRIDTSTGAMKPVTAPRWQWLQRVAFVRGGRALAVIGQEQDSSFQQIWYVPLRGGTSRRVTADLDDYIGVSVAGGDTKMVSVQLETLSNIYVTSARNPRDAVQITPGGGRYFDLSWTPDGKILYASDATGVADLWMMNADGTAQRQLTSGTGRSYAPAVSPDGKLIAFHSNRSGNWNIWRADADGSNPRQLTANTQDSNWPQFTPDGRNVVYHHTGIDAMWNLWTVPAEGGVPRQLTDHLTTHPAVSPSTGLIACWHAENKDKPVWKLALFPPDGGDEPVRTLAAPPTVMPDSTLRWTPAGDAVTMVDARGGVGNIWLAPLDGRPGRALTSFTSGQIYSFDWSRDGRLAISRGISTSDVVLISDTERK